MSQTAANPNPPHFDDDFAARLQELIRWRRDVRRFRSDPVEAASIDALIALAALAPSVGYSQPWRFVHIDDPARRDAIRENYRRCNHEALEDFHGERAKLYASLKLAGLEDAPVQLAVYCDEGTDTGHGLGRKTMPETLRYSVVMAVHTLWLAARARGLGVGWVSILDPDEVTRRLDLPGDWSLIAYLCIGYPVEEQANPVLERSGWESRQDLSSCVLRR